MLEIIDLDVIEAFAARKIEQFTRVATSMAGLQLIRSGERGSQFMLVVSRDDRYEGVVIGQLPHVVVERTTVGRNIGRRLAPDTRKPVDKRGIDLTDAEIDAVLAAWAAGRSALTVPAVTHVYDRHGLIKQ